MTTIKETEANLLFNLYSRSIPTTTYPRFLSKIRVGDEEYSSLSASLKIDNGSAVITCTSLEKAENRSLNDYLDRFGKVTLSGVTQYGELFRANRAGVMSLTFSETGHQFIIQSYYWALGDGEASMWAGQVSTELSSYFGNLSIVAHTGGVEHISSFHLLLKGSVWTYYILRKGNRQANDILLINTHGRAIDPAILDRELRALSFCFGYPITCSFFTGIDYRGNVVGQFGGAFGDYRLNRNFTDTPIANSPDESWTELFFQQLTKQLAANNAQSVRISEAINLYVEASTEANLTSRAVKLLTTAMTAAHYFLEGDPYWINKTGDLQDRTDKVLRRVGEDSDSNPVGLLTRALRKAGLEARTELINAVRRSFQIVLGFLPEENFRESVASCELLRTLSIGLIASAIGYKGPISLKSFTTYSLERTANSSFASGLTDWWRFNSTFDVKPDHFLAEVTQLIPVPDSSDLWPIFERPAVPRDSQVSVIEEFAKSLAAKTREQVRARLLPLPVYSDERNRLYDLVLESIKYPLANSILFTVRQETPTAGLEILNWEDSVELILSDTELYAFLKRVASSSRTRHAVERLLLATPND